MGKMIVIAIVAILACQVPLHAQTTRRNPDFVLTPIKITSLKASPYMYVSEQTTIDTIWDVIDKRMREMNVGMKDGAFSPAGPPVFVFHDAGPDRNKPFTLDIGFPVDANAVAAGDYQLGKLESTREATAVYMGSFLQLGQAYRRIYAEIFAAGLTPTGDRRERFLYYDDFESTNNVVLIEIMVKK